MLKHESEQLEQQDAKFYLCKFTALLVIENLFLSQSKDTYIFLEK